ncbi:MAG: transposase [Pyrinomonadaceae bacterium]
MALETRPVPPGLVHHSDRGVQYAAADYVALLQEHKIQISMSRTGNPYDNAKAERFMRTLKYEEIYLNDYETLAEVLASVQHFIEAVYNRKRLHSAIGYLPPAEFEASLSPPIQSDHRRLEISFENNLDRRGLQGSILKSFLRKSRKMNLRAYQCGAGLLWALAFGLWTLVTPSRHHAGPCRYEYREVADGGVCYVWSIG